MREEKISQSERERDKSYGYHLTIFGFHFGVDSISEEVMGFSPFMVSPRKIICVSCLLCFIAVLVILSVKDPNVMLA